MRKIITIILLLNVLPLMSQTDELSHEKFTIGITFSPDIYLQSTGYHIGEYSYYEVAPLNFNFITGLIGQKMIKSRLNLGVGLLYSIKDYWITKYHNNYNYFPGDPKSDLIKMRYINIPIFVRYHIDDNKFGFYVQAGITKGFLTNEIDSKYMNIFEINNFRLGGEFGIGLDIDLGQRCNISCSTLYKPSLIRFAEKASFKLSSFGIQVELNYKIISN